MALTNLIDTLGLKKLFQKAEAGDAQAKIAIQAFNDAPELTGAAFAAPGKADLDVPLVQQLPSDLPAASSSPGLSSLVTGGTKRPEDYASMGIGGEYTQEPGKGIGGFLKQASILLSDYGRSGRGMQGMEAPAHVQRFKAEQIDQLKRRHQMWDTAYQASQGLPPEVLQDPKFASLGQAKAALDKDMMDGKVDNEKNVSLFLTELARFKPELDQVSLLSKVKTQAAGEGLLQKERERLGLALPMEQQDYNFEGSPVTRTEYLKLDSERKQKAEERAHRLAVLEETIRGRKDVAGINAAARQDALGAQKDTQTLTGVRHLVDSAAAQYAEPDPNDPLGKPRVTPKSMVQAVMDNKDAILNAAKNLGVVVEEPDVTRGTEVYRVGGQSFGRNELPDLLMYLYQVINSGR